MLATYRHRSGFTQLELSLRAGISIRHLSFLERAHARPSAAMIGRLASSLHLGFHDEDELMTAAGFATRWNAGASLGAHIFDTALYMNAATNPRQLIEASRAPLARLGVAHFFCGTLTPTRPISSLIDFDPEGVFPVAWLQRYREQRYRVHDPLVREALRASSAYFWADVASRDAGLSKRERHVIDEAGDFGITGGFVVTLRRADGSIRAVSMMGRDIDARDGAVRVALRTIGTCLLDTQERLAATVRPATLTPEALECLRWTLDNQSPQQIAQKLGLGIRAIRGHLRTACTELGVRDRRQAAARAVALHLIRSA